MEEEEEAREVVQGSSVELPGRWDMLAVGRKQSSVMYTAVVEGFGVGLSFRRSICLAPLPGKRDEGSSFLVCGGGRRGDLVI